ncbi:lysine--tRNA ligase [Candidatus Parcubacteria bacterium]|nr:lysine--tRNA ligase [Candidatus Parcubacteria bacterium]
MKITKVSEHQERLKKLKELQKLGINPYPAQSCRTYIIKDVFDKFSLLEKSQKTITAVGRLRSLRSHGNLTFAHLEDASGRIQIALSKKEIRLAATNGDHANGNKDGPELYKIFTKLIDTGDFIEIMGKCFLTHKGEKSIMVKQWKILTKTLRPLPDKWHGLKDEEERYRKRYLDILFNPEVREMIEKKAIFWNAVREFMVKKGFLEVETPVLENTTGGADARPFITHHNALDIDVYLRISMGELWQKRLMVAGLEKTFEIGRQFRNEGMDAEHLQDYSQMEFYWAYADYQDGMKLVEELYKYIAEQTFGTLEFKIGKFNIDLSKKWQRYDYQETVKKYTGINVLNTDIEQIEKKLKELKIEYDKKGFNITRAIDNLWKYCRKQIAGPGFLVGVPIQISPLAKSDEKNPQITQRFQPIIAGAELGNGYSELNDPVDQRERFNEQQKLREAGDEEAQMFDHEFVEALEYGMPPTCGFGMSERVFSFLMNKTARECQIFPLMKPKSRI